MDYDENVVATIKKRLLAMPPDVSFSIGEYGDFSRNELITEVEKRSEIGMEIIEMQLTFIRRMPLLLKSR